MGNVLFTAYLLTVIGTFSFQLPSIHFSNTNFILYNYEDNIRKKYKMLSMNFLTEIDC